MSINMRPMTDRDKPAVMAILRATPEFKPSEVAIAEELIDSYLQFKEKSGYYTVVAEMDSKITGYICYGPTPLTRGSWDIYWMAVAADKQGKGIGSAMAAFAESDIKQSGGRLIFIETSSLPLYRKTRYFYRRLNYEVICQITDFYEVGDDKVIYQKRVV